MLWGYIGDLAGRFAQLTLLGVRTVGFLYLAQVLVYRHLGSIQRSPPILRHLNGCFHLIALVLVYKYPGTYWCSSTVPIYRVDYLIFVALVLVYRHLGAFQWSPMLLAYPTVCFQLFHLVLVYKHLGTYWCSSTVVTDRIVHLIFVALVLVYKHLVHNSMMRNSFIKTKTGKLKSPWSLYTSICRTTAWREIVWWSQRTVN